MDSQRQVHEALYRFVRGKVVVTLLPATVTAINTVDQTIDVADMDGNAIYDVRIKSVVDGLDSGVQVYPLNNSQVIIGNIGDSPNEFVLIAVTKLSKYRVVILGEPSAELTVDASGINLLFGSSQVVLTANSVLVKNGAGQIEVKNTGGVAVRQGAETLKAVLNDLLAQIQLLTVNTSGVPSTVPINVAAFAAIQTRINTLLST